MFIEALRKRVREAGTDTYRRPLDLIYLLFSLLGLIVATLLVLASEGVIRATDIGLLQQLYVSPLPEAATGVANLILRIGTPLGVGIVAGLVLLVRRFRLALKLVIGATVASFFSKVLKTLIQRGRPADVIEEITVRAAEIEGYGFPSGHVTIVAAMAAVVHPYLSRRLRWLSWLIVLLVAVAQLYVGALFPLDVVGGVALGTVVGTLVNLVLGVPKEYLADDAIRQIFDEYGITLTSIHQRRERASGSDTYHAEADDGTRYFVKVVGDEHRNADFLYKVWRSLLLTGTGENAPYLTPLRQIEHEAYLIHRVRSRGVRTPGIKFTDSMHGFAVLAQEEVTGRQLNEIEPDELDAELVTDLWRQVQCMHDEHIVHRDLQASNILVDDDGHPWIVDFGMAVVSRDSGAYIVDIAQLLATLAPVIGVERTVESGREAVGMDTLARAVPALQPMVVSEGQSISFTADDDTLEELRDVIADRADTDVAEDETVLRFRPRTIMWVVGLGLGVYLLLPQLTELSQVLDAWRQAHPLWLAAGIIGSAITYVMTALAQYGAVSDKTSYWRHVVVQMGASFANRFSPRGVGSALVTQSFLERTGVKRRNAAAAFGLKTGAIAAVHGVGALGVLLFLGHTFDRIPLLDSLRQNWQLVLGGLVAVVLLIAVAWNVFDLNRYWRTVEKTAHDLYATLRQPVKAAELFGGAVGMTAAYILTLAVSMWAVQAPISIVTAAAVYLAGTVIGSASPTPGGLGVVEGAYVAALAAFGVGSGTAVAGVLLYRLFTFWLPILPGFVAFRYLQKEGYL